ncbi:MAG: hypothetical protein K6E90_09975 [Lachnospiraceae bacterium]|nr:hypothetical protein [Lachnospiraceae bacterium]
MGKDTENIEQKDAVNETENKDSYEKENEALTEGAPSKEGGESKEACASKEASQSTEDLLRQILEADKKEVKYAKRAAFFMMGIFLIFLVAAIILVPKIVTTLNSANTAIKAANETLVQANEALTGINTMTTSITGTSDKMNSMLVDNSQSLTDAVDKMNKIDFAGLNQAIQDLQDAVGPFATLMNKFK